MLLAGLPERDYWLVRNLLKALPSPGNSQNAQHMQIEWRDCMNN